MGKRLRWGIVGTGYIAGVFAEGLAASSAGELIAVGSRTQESAQRFGEKYGVPRRHGSYEALLADRAVEAVYISTPHPLHARWAIRAAEAGKHVLCEKPLALNHPEAMAVIEAARESDVFLMEAFMYRCHPQTTRLLELIRGGAIGEVKVIQATFSFQAGFNPASRLFNQALGGGGILDVGCYCTSMARLIAGAASGKPFEDPVEVRGTGHIGDVSRVDEFAVASLRFPSGIIAELATGVRVSQENVVRIFGAEGWVLVPEPWTPGRHGEPTKILVQRPGTEPQETVIRPEAALYAIEADTVAAHLKDRQAPPPAMTWDDTLGNMRALDAWRASIGLVYDLEKPGAGALTAAGRRLSLRPDSKMKFGEIAGVGKPVARLVMGVDNQMTWPHAAVMFDDYFGRGGNCFDTAHIYGGGLPERLLGDWVGDRGLRDQVVIVAKGAHTPLNRPEHLAPQLEESLARLKTEYADILLAHRDNPEVPVDEWADAFNQLLAAGLIRCYGGSNWTVERVQALNDYARAKGLVGMAAVSNNFSLARMVSPVWSGCIAASDPESRAWFARTQTPLLAWSSQARGFFTERARPGDLSEAELARTWYSEDNFRRQARAKELAEKRGLRPITVALAYVLCQPFPTFALIGPRTLQETHISMEAPPVELSAEELKWLNLEV